MIYTYSTDAGDFVLRRLAYTDGSWELLFNGRFVDVYPDPAAAARCTATDDSPLQIGNALLLPPATLSGWEVRWSERLEQEAAELWLHRLYLEGREGRMEVDAGLPVT